MVRLSLFAVLLFLALAGQAQAQNSTPADTMGKFLGFTVMCDCFNEEPEHLQALYYALLVDWRDESYASAASGFMRETADNAGRYHAEANFCWEVCNNDFVPYLDDVMTMIDMQSEPISFIENYTWAYQAWFGDTQKRSVEELYIVDPEEGPWANPFCHSQPNSPQCRRTTETDD